MNQSFPVEYDFKTTKLKLIKNGQLKKKYKCLPYMITLPLSSPLNPIPDPNPADPVNKQTIVNSIDTDNGWLNFNIIQNVQPNIITILDNTLYFNKYSYNYRITVDVVSKGDTSTPLRFMAQNPYSLLASNMNDVYSNETVYNVYNGQKIQFTVTGEYQFFYIHYDTTNFNLNITINVDYNIYPDLVCRKKRKCQCGKIESKKNKNCTCYEKNGNGYLKDDCKDIPVYTTRIIGETVTQYLYPEFGYLRDLFYNITLSNSLPAPTSLQANLLTTTVIKCSIADVVGLCFVKLWGNYELISGDMVELSSSLAGCPFNQIKETTNSSKYRYSWDNTAPLISSSSVNQNIYFGVYLWHSGAWYEQKRYLLNNNYTLNSDHFDNSSDYQWISFALIPGTTNAASVTPTNNTFNITITEI